MYDISLLQRIRTKTAKNLKDNRRKTLKKRKKCDIIILQDKQVCEALSIEKSSLGGASRQLGGTSC